MAFEFLFFLFFFFFSFFFFLLLASLSLPAFPTDRSPHLTMRTSTLLLALAIALLCAASFVCAQDDAAAAAAADVGQTETTGEQTSQTHRQATHRRGDGERTEERADRTGGSCGARGQG